MKYSIAYLKKLRLMYGISLAELANKLNVTRQTLWNLEAGKGSKCLYRLYVYELTGEIEPSYYELKCVND